MRGSICNLSLVVGGEMAKRGAWFNRVRVSSGGKSEREAQLLKICLVGQREILIEPFGHEHLRCRAPIRAAISKLDACAHEHLWRLGERDHTEPKWQAQVNVSLIEANVANRECGRRHVQGLV